MSTNFIFYHLHIEMVIQRGYVVNRVIVDKKALKFYILYLLRKCLMCCTILGGEKLHKIFKIVNNLHQLIAIKLVYFETDLVIK